MNVTGIIAEYNPLHNGHEYHIKKAKEETNAKYIIVVMSGNHVQRGEPSVFNKWIRTEAALKAGADLVIELPLYYSTGSIDYFAKGAVSLLNDLNVVNNISFGSESGDMGLLKEAANFLAKEKVTQSCSLPAGLKSGVNYATRLLSQDYPEVILKLLSTPNNLLGVHYLLALNEMCTTITPHTLKREASDYNDTDTTALSSSSIRKELINEGLTDNILSKSPKCTHDTLKKYLEAYAPITPNDYSMMLFYKIQQVLNKYSDISNMSQKSPLLIGNGLNSELTEYTDISVSLANKIAKKYKDADTYENLIADLKSKDLTYTRISRGLLHILLDEKTSNLNEYIADDYNYYARILGFKKSSSLLLHKLKRYSKIPLITKLADAHTALDNFYLSDNYRKSGTEHSLTMYKHALRMLDEEINASELYTKTACTKSRQPFISEYEQQIIIV